MQMGVDLLLEFRHELKYIISYSDYISLKSKLSGFLELDSNVDLNGEYIVRSLYFDNFYDKVLNEKINGINNREKFRIRIYNNNTSLIKLEKKVKLNGLCKKESEIISINEYYKIISNDIDWMKYSSKALIRELYLKMKLELLKPKMIVEYIRTPFVYSGCNLRITFDRKIKSSVNDIDILNFDMPLISKDENIIIMEIKYDKFIPDYIKKLIKLKNTSLIAYSKYGNNRLW